MPSQHAVPNKYLQNSRWCGLAGRNFTDLLSNVVYLAPLSSPTELASLWDRRLEGHRLTELMHEFVHHQSLVSPVGHALCLLGFGCQRTAWFMNDSRDQRFVNHFAGQILRFEAATIALRPLGEGIALFAEHDFYPGTQNPRSLLALVTDLIGVGFYPVRYPIESCSTNLEWPEVGIRFTHQTTIGCGLVQNLASS